MIDTSNIDINNDLVKISRWAYQWKMSFNPDINKQATEVYFSQRREKSASTNHFQQQQCTDFSLPKTPGSCLG